MRSLQHLICFTWPEMKLNTDEIETVAEDNSTFFLQFFPQLKITVISNLLLISAGSEQIQQRSQTVLRLVKIPKSAIKSQRSQSSNTFKHIKFSQFQIIWAAVHVHFSTILLLFMTTIFSFMSIISHKTLRISW